MIPAKDRKKKSVYKNFIFIIYSIFCEEKTITNVQLPGFNKFLLGIDNKQFHWVSEFHTAWKTL